MEPNKYYNTQFKFTNMGDSELIIEKVHATCGCTVPTLKKKNYEPGESGTIQVRYHAQKSAGPVNKSITVYSNNQADPTTQLHLKGSVELTVDVEPKVLSVVLEKG